ncbi:aminopeptidase N [Kordiimonas sediminis]|uniref:Aminopeptidase N n=1 Tax=Kordiimonas sediminis TaxID=1735581 RepID=A0A919AWG6_9PROT|nr:aminopeptidase N [Kordiimonas sediminis]GHF29269.1 aminopeptidase N [Kordiimonas sediminis]
MDAGLNTSGVKQEIFLKDYTSPAFMAETVDLLFDLDEDTAIVTSRVTYKRMDSGQSNLVLNGGEFMKLLSVNLDGHLLGEDAYVVTEETLTVKSVPDVFTLTIQTELYPADNTRLEGLYKSGGNFCTQCEAEGFRHITYFPDRPDVMAVYTVRIEADKARYPILLSNGNPGKTGDLPEGRHFAEWYDPYPKPSYLFAVVAGNLGVLSDTYKTKSGKRVDLNIYAAEADLEKCHHAMAALKASMKWDEDVFGLEYDLDVYNILAVGDFNMGAMENKGLNVFNTKYVLASPETATDADFDHVEGVIGHEYFHNWTGNRVTCRDWFQLSLKEGLTVFRDQEFSSDLGSRALKRIDDVRLLRAAQFPEDAGPLAHSVRPDHYVEINNFYTATVYNKGAEVIRMMHRLIGAQAFRKGMELYFNRHDGQAVTCDDFAAAMQDSSGKNLDQFKLWYSQAGTPTLTVTRERDGGDILLTVHQSCPPTPGQPEKEPNHLPFLMGWIGPNGEPLEPACSNGVWQEDGCLLEISNSTETFRFKDVPTGSVPSLLRTFTAPVHLKHDLSKEEKLFLMSHDRDPFARWDITQDLLRVEILRLVDSYKDGKAQETVDKDVLDAFGTVLADESADPAFIAELILLPSENDLGQYMDVIKPEEIYLARTQFISQVADAHRDIVLERYKKCREMLENQAQYSLDKNSKGLRRLSNTLLGFIKQTSSGEDVCCEHYNNATNMTDQFAALSVIASSEFQCRNEILANFYHQWKGEDLVIDKWFMAQAMSRRDDALENIVNLIDHPDFSLTNPNRMRSLVMVFAGQNQRHFHANDGRGYNFLAEIIVKVDKVNPQVAARLVAPLGRWKKLDPHRQKLMKTSLDAILNAKHISDDVGELVAKSLAT